MLPDEYRVLDIALHILSGILNVLFAIALWRLFVEVHELRSWIHKHTKKEEHDV